MKVPQELDTFKMKIDDNHKNIEIKIKMKASKLLI